MLYQQWLIASSTAQKIIIPIPTTNTTAADKKTIGIILFLNRPKTRIIGRTKEASPPVRLVRVGFVSVRSSTGCDLAQTTDALGQLPLVCELGAVGCRVIPLVGANEEYQCFALREENRRILRAALGDLTTGDKLDQEPSLWPDLDKILLELDQC